ncbi:MAG: hypothetical protein RLY86_1482 [Pseudomonadota bacterium]|jgi:copper(I)-binding protein
MRASALLSFIAAISLWAGVADAADVTVGDAFVRAGAAQATAGAAFMTLTSPTSDRLIAASSPVAERVELHTHIMDGGIARMRKVEGGIDLPAGAPVALQPGGLHIMLIGLKQPLREGETIQVALTFATAPALTVDVPVKGAAYRPHGGGAHH